MVRVDKRGRRIGVNAWRDLIVSSWWSAWLTWDSERERYGVGYETETREFERDNRQPTLKEFMIGLARK